MMNRQSLLAFMCCLPLFVLGQTNNLTGSPYSLFGLGVSTNANIGKNSALGRGGYALSGEEFINPLNPASYAGIPEKSFLFDVGFLTEISTLSNGNREEQRVAGSFSNIALATSLDAKSSIGLSITPFTDVGYSLIGLESNAEGSFDVFTANVFGSGALNDLRLAYGYAVVPQLRVGAALSYLFGTIEERESVQAGSSFISPSTLNVTDENRYSGIRLGIGVQYDLNPKFTLAWGVNLPTNLAGSRDRSVAKTLDFVPFEVSTETDLDLDDFKLPLELNTGLVYSPIPSLFINADYALKLWGATEQQDNVGEFRDQYVYSLGAEYIANPKGFKFWERIGFRAGYNYDSGYLSVNETAINTTTFTAGLGIPLGFSSLSRLNLSFARSFRGDTGGILVEERFNTINVNLSLRDFWFFKRKIE
ncbi:OmpP1/FadL family transporter [Poritiphilus flavus]|uniref:Long-chain fatty acid transport protein n=1 Tax=Poritiphilus flavus TaxID=2697053 RepID=A0A6L9EB28_9FLAO|nr:hypothetical protein [Poritiphilus flavus]NAS11946.1 hypothetical protein [Poritiphilus flavus]